MAVTYNTTLKNARLDEVIAAIGSSGKLEIGTAGMGSVLATIPLANPAGSSSGGVLTFSGVPAWSDRLDFRGVRTNCSGRRSGSRVRRLHAAAWWRVCCAT